jgi:hypothetical protein
MGHDGYEGWTDWETWHTKLIQDNDEALHNAVVGLARRCADIKAGRIKNKMYDHARATNAFKRVMADAWRETREFARTNGWTVGRPNWSEIAESYIGEAERGE